MLKTYKGSCHCGAVLYEADIDLAQGTGKCNCTFCKKVRAWKAFVRPAAFRLPGGGDHVTGYHKHPQSSLKYFCQECGVRTHERGSADYMGGEFVGVFVNTLDDVEPLGGWGERGRREGGGEGRAGWVGRDGRVRTIGDVGDRIRNG